MTAEDLVRAFEGCILTAYKGIDDIWTIGYGHTGKDVYRGLIWTQDQAEDALQHDLQAAAALLAIYSAGLSGGVLEALKDFVFNLGIGAYRSSTLRVLVNAGNYAQAKIEILKWDKVHGNVVAGLLRRRQAEAALFP